MDGPRSSVAARGADAPAGDVPTIVKIVGPKRRAGGAGARGVLAGAVDVAAAAGRSRQRRELRSLPAGGRALHAVGEGGATGTVTCGQRVGSALKANIHFHAVVPDLVFVPGDDGAVSVARLPPPTDEDVELLLHRTTIWVLRMLKGALGDGEPDVDALA